MAPMATVLPGITFFTRFPSFFKADRIWIFRAFYNAGPALVNGQSGLKTQVSGGRQQASGRAIKCDVRHETGEGKIKGVNSERFTVKGNGKGKNKSKTGQLSADGRR
jgi:hypothetical protein